MADTPRREVDAPLGFEPELHHRRVGAGRQPPPVGEPVEQHRRTEVRAIGGGRPAVVEALSQDEPRRLVGSAGHEEVDGGGGGRGDRGGLGRRGVDQRPTREPPRCRQRRTGGRAGRRRARCRCLGRSRPPRFPQGAPGMARRSRGGAAARRARRTWCRSPAPGRRRRPPPAGRIGRQSESSSAGGPTVRSPRPSSAIATGIRMSSPLFQDTVVSSRMPDTTTWSSRGPHGLVEGHHHLDGAVGLGSVGIGGTATGPRSTPSATRVSSVGSEWRRSLRTWSRSSSTVKGCSARTRIHGSSAGTPKGVCQAVVGSPSSAIDGVARRPPGIVAEASTVGPWRPTSASITGPGASRREPHLADHPERPREGQVELTSELRLGIGIGLVGGVVALDGSARSRAHGLRGCRRPRAGRPAPG